MNMQFFCAFFGEEVLHMRQKEIDIQHEFEKVANRNCTEIAAQAAAHHNGEI